MKKATATLTTTLGLVLGSLHAQTVPPFLNYQGKVTDSAGVGLGTGTPVNRLVIFRVFDAPTGGNRLWSEQHTVTISNGEFSVLLGNGTNAFYNGATEAPTKTTTPLDTVFTSAGILRYVEIVVDNGDGTLNATDAPITPRQQITSTAYSFRARSADTITAGTDLQLNGSANYGLGYYGSTRLFNGVPVDGPVLFGNAGGALGSFNGATRNIALRWNAAGAVGVGSADLAGAAATTKLVLQGDDSNTIPLQLNIRGNSDTNKRLMLGYNTSSNYGSIQAYSGASNTSPLLLNQAGGNVSIGTTDTANKLTVGGNVNVIGNLAALTVNATNVNAVTVSSNNSYANRVSANGSGGFSFDNVGDTDGGMFSPADGTIVFRTDATEKVRITPGGTVGIGTNNPQATLDVRSSVPRILVGSPDGSDGALYFGNANHGIKRFYASNNDVGVYTTAGSLYLSAAGAGVTTHLAVTGAGRVGIGTSNPQAGLEVATRVNLSIFRLGYVANSGFNDGDGTSTWDVAIKTNGVTSSDAFVVQSDSRIKNIVGVSKGTDDLKTLQGIEITDYTMKTAVSSDNRIVHKKVIAQQVEKVFPQAVTKGQGTVPDVAKMVSAKDGWITLATDLKVGERVRLITEEKDTIQEVVEIDKKAGKFRTDLDFSAEKVFVYGREVKDFRTVDYDAIAMLNVSATQQIKKEKDAEVKALTDENTELRARVAALEAKDASRDAKISAIEKALLSADGKAVGHVSTKIGQKAE